MKATLSNVHGSLLIMRPPVPATVNKAGANYKSEVPHLEYSPRAAYGEWLAICEAISACGGDALFLFEDSDTPLLDVAELRVDAAGQIFAMDSEDAIGDLADVMTGRVFSANGPWVTTGENRLRAVMPNMLPHRQPEADYYRQLLGDLAADCGRELELVENPHRWEGMADVAVVGDRVVLTYAVPGHYDEGVLPKSPRSSREGAAFAADSALVPEGARIYAELRYPHFHGDTVHFGARPKDSSAVLVQYPQGLWGDGASRIRETLGADAIIEMSEEDAVSHYCGNSRQVRSGLLMPDGGSTRFESQMQKLGLEVHRVSLRELFGKAGGGPGCTTLYLPDDLEVPLSSPLRYSVKRDAAHQRRERLPNRLVVDPEYFSGRSRG